MGWWQWLVIKCKIIDWDVIYFSSCKHYGAIHIYYGPYLCAWHNYLKSLPAVLGSQWNWGEGTELSIMSPFPTHAGCPVISIPCHSGALVTLTHYHPKSTVYMKSHSLDNCIMTCTCHCCIISSFTVPKILYALPIHAPTIPDKPDLFTVTTVLLLRNVI